MNARVVALLNLVLFTLLAVLLASQHSGAAIKFVAIVYISTLTSIIYLLFKNEKK